MRPDKKLAVTEYAGNNKNRAILRYRTLDEMATALKQSMVDDKNRTHSCDDDSGDPPWQGTKTAQEYIDMLDNGWKHGVEDVEGLDGLSTDAAEKLTFTRSVGGAFPIVPAFLAGDPNSMLMPIQDTRDNVRGLTLVIDSSFHAGVAAETVLEYARSVMRLVAWLQSERIECSIYIVCPVQFGTQRVIYCTPIRETGDVLQPERIAAVVHPSWLRRAWFAMVERDYFDREIKACRECLDGYGRVRHVSADEMREVLPESYSVIMLPKVGSGDPQRAVQEAINLKLRQG